MRPVSIGMHSFDVVYDVMASMHTLDFCTTKTPYPEVPINTFIFFLRSLCKYEKRLLLICIIIWINIHDFPNAPRMSISCLSGSKGFDPIL